MFAAASAIGVGASFGLNLALARILSVEDFGVTRLVTAALVVLSTLGQFALHDALSSTVARAGSKEEVADLFHTATRLVAGLAVAVAVVAMVWLVLYGYGNAITTRALLVLVPTVPVLALTAVYVNSLQAIGSEHGIVVTQAATGLVPLLLIVLGSFWWSLTGWMVAKALVAAILLGLVYFFVKERFEGGRPTHESRKKLLTFARLQFFSAVLSQGLISGDVIVLEAVTGSLATVANYSLGAIVVRATGFLPMAIGRGYFAAVARPGLEGEAARRAYLARCFWVGIPTALLISLVGSRFITPFFGEDYVEAGHVVVVWSIALLPLFLWQAISLINVANGLAKRSLAISTAGVMVGLPLLWVLGERLGAIGAAWACVAAYLAGAVLGAWNLVRDGLLYRKRGLR